MFRSRDPPRTPAKPSIPFAQLAALPTYNSISKSRLQALYADFSRQKQSNPASFQSNLDWWRRALTDVTVRGLQLDCKHRLVLNATPVLPDAFRYESVGKPLSLGAVIAELTQTRDLFPLPHFLSSTQSVYDTGSLAWRIASFVVGRPLWWALQQTGLVGADDSGGSAGDAQRWKRIKGEYVVLALVERAADAVEERQAEKESGDLADVLYDFEGFKREFADVLEEGVLSDQDLRVLVKFLERDRKVVVTDKTAIKFLSSDSAEPTITPVETGLLELKNAVFNVQAQVDRLQTQIDARARQAADAVRQKRPKELALLHLRARRALEAVLTKRIGALDNLQNTLLQVEAAAGDVEIMKSYETSAATLRAVLAHPSLQREHVTATLDALANASADAREVDDAIRAGADTATGAADIDEDDIAAELAALVGEAEQEKEAAELAKKHGQDSMRMPETPTKKATQGGGERTLLADQTERLDAARFDSGAVERVPEAI